MYTAFMAALKAVPLIVDGIRELGHIYHQLQSQAIERRFAKLREEMNEVTKRIESAPDHTSRKELARRLSDAMDK